MFKRYRKYRNSIVAIFVVAILLSIYLVSSYYTEGATWNTEIPGFGVLVTSISAEYSDGTSEILYKNVVNQFVKDPTTLVFRKTSGGAIVLSVTYTISGLATASGYTGCEVDLSGLTIKLTVIRQSDGTTKYTGSWLQSGTKVITVNSAQTIVTKVIDASLLTTIDNAFPSGVDCYAVFTFSCSGTLRYRGTGGQTGSWISIGLPANAAVTLFRDYA